MKKTIPAISIIIPMYNVEKYIGECLDSILAQTFTDYEVIIVDDCSTDKSCDVVESYMKKFNKKSEDKLQLIRSKKNSGGCPGVPRNTGLRMSCGEYILFVDSDDAIVSDALETLSRLAKKFNADVIHCEKYFQAEGDTVTTDKKLLTERSGELTEFVTKPTFISDKLEDRVRDFGNFKMIGYTCNNFIKRRLIVENDIKFPALRAGEDHIFTFFLLSFAKNILRVPYTFYVYRNTDAGITHGKNLSVEKLIHRWTESLFKGTGILDKFMNEFEVLKNNSELKYLVFASFLQYHVINLLNVYAQIPAHRLDDLIRQELSEVEDKTALTAFLFNRMEFLTINNIRMQNHIKQQAAQIQQLQSQLNSK